MTTPPFLKIAFLLVCLLVSQNSDGKKRTRQRRKRLYSKSETNQIIDSLLHPLSDQSWAFVALDGVAHALNEFEDDPIQTLLKFARFDLPELLKRLMKELKESKQD